jgi:CO/xanthine dehydrogenase Mo-binding subunit
VEDPFQLPAALEAVRAEWRIPQSWQQSQLDALLDVERHIADDDFEHGLASSGDLDEGRAAASSRLTARYDTPFAAHAVMEPRAAVAWVRQDKVEVWCGSQDPFFVRGRVARITGRDAEDVVVHTHHMGGAFGGRVVCQASEEAAILSAAVGRPVRVQWTRETEFRHNHFHPRFSHFIDAGVTEAGTISHWRHDFVSSPIIFSSAVIPRHLRWAVDLVGDFGTARGATPPYRIANKRVSYSDVRIPVPTGTWRGLGAAPNTFAIECMMDEMAAAAGLDPLELRIKNLPPEQARLAATLRRAAGMSAWGRATPSGTGRGIACAVYQGATSVAVVAEVRVDHAERTLRVARAWCAQDCGLVINPDQVKAQITGNLIWGCSMAFKERIIFRDASAEADNFDGYEIFRNEEAPDIEIALIEPPDAKPVGVGEPAIAPTAAAVANAVFAATGKRARRLPITYDGVFGAGKA